MSDYTPAFSQDKTIARAAEPPADEKVSQIKLTAAAAPGGSPMVEKPMATDSEDHDIPKSMETEPMTAEGPAKSADESVQMRGFGSHVNCCLNI